MNLILSFKLLVYVYTIIFFLGIAFTNGDAWKVMKRFSISTLRELGLGKKTIETRIQDELIPLIERFKSYNGKKNQY